MRGSWLDVLLQLGSRFFGFWTLKKNWGFEIAGRAAIWITTWSFKERTSRSGIYFVNRSNFAFAFLYFGFRYQLHSI